MDTLFELFVWFLVGVFTVGFWWMFFRMMKDVHRIAEALDPPKPKGAKKAESDDWLLEHKMKRGRGDSFSEP